MPEMHDRVTSSESPVGRGLSGRWGFGVLIALSLALCPRVEAAERQPPMVFKTLAQDAGLTQNTVNASNTGSNAGADISSGVLGQLA